VAQVVGAKLALKAVGRELAGGEGHDAGVVDEEVERGAGEAFDDARGEGVDGVEIGEVEDLRVENGGGSLAKDARDGVAGLGLRARGQDDFSAVAGEFESCFKANTAVCAGD
jgi:hypothetical protein